MSTGLTKTKRRISSIENTQKTTKAMGLIAMVKLKRFLNMYEKQNLYSNEFLQLMGILFAHDQEVASHYAKVNNDADKSLYLVITSNLGLCGGYNSNLYKFVDENVKENDVIAPIGSKGINHYKHSKKFKSINDEFAYLDLSTDMADIHNLCLKLKDQFNEGKYKRICIVYTHYINSIRSCPMMFQLLPVQVSHTPWPNESFCPPEFDASPRVMIHKLMPNYLASVLYDRLVESQLSEQSTRRNAMDSANDNADELLSKLRIEYNKARQAAITQQITEIVGGIVE